MEDLSMETAVANFRSRMASANRAFIQARISEQRGQEKPEADKVEAMSHVWFSWTDNHQGWKRIIYPNPDARPLLKEQAAHEATVKTLDDIATLPHYHMDGTQAPCDEDTRERFLTAFEKVINNNADTEMLGSDEWIELPEELEEFLAESNGVFDPDFRHSGICDFSLIKYPEADDDLMYTTLNRTADPERWGELGVTSLENELEVAAGILLDEAGQWPLYEEQHEVVKWFSIYAYCRNKRDPDEDEDEEDWGWKVIFYNKTGFVEYEVFSFSSIAEFLEWHATWDTRLDEEDMRKATSGEPPEWASNGNEIAQYT